MERRPLGKTGFAVSEIGYGAWGIGGSMWGGADDDESIEALNRAIDLGVVGSSPHRAADAPCAVADLGDLESGFSQRATFHGLRLPRDPGS